MDLRRGTMSYAFPTEFPGTTPVWRRAFQTSESQTTSESSLNQPHSSTTPTSLTTTTTSNKPLFQDPTSVTPVSSSSSQSQTISKVALEYVLVAALAVIFGGLLIQRLVFGRRNRTSLWSSRQSASSPGTDVPALPRRFPRTTGLTEVPPYPYSRRTRALDTDVAGRRVLDSVNISDHDGYIGDKDVLPAYDNCGGPPQYREVALELNVMPPTRRGNGTSANDFGPGNVEDFRPPVHGTDDARGPRDPLLLSGSGQGSGDAIRQPESLAIPAVAHVRQ